MGGKARFLVSTSARDGRPAQVAVFPTALGWMWCEWLDGRVQRNSFGHATLTDARESLGGDWQTLAHDEAHNEEDDAEERVDKSLVQLVERLTRFAERFDDDLLDVPLALEGTTPFVRRVLEACRQIPIGETLTYAELARLGGSPGAARAAGNTMARNRFPLIVPCHRVVGSHGALGGYSAPSGLSMKRRLLAAEARTCSLLPLS